MKWIKLIKGTIKLRNLVNGKAMLDGDGREINQSHIEFYRDRICDPVFGTGSANIRAQDKIAHALDDAEESKAEHLPLEDADYKLLLQSIDSPHPGRPFDTRCQRCQIPYIDATANPETEDPAKKEPAPPAVKKKLEHADVDA